MGLAEFKADAKLARERILGLTNSEIDLKHELTENILPLFEAMCDAIDEDVVADLDGLSDAVDELIDQAEDVLHPETAAKLMGVLELGKLLAKELQAVLPRCDEVTRKRGKALIKGYLQGFEVMKAEITEITIPDEPDEVPDPIPANDDAAPNGGEPVEPVGEEA